MRSTEHARLSVGVAREPSTGETPNAGARAASRSLSNSSWPRLLPLAGVGILILLWTAVSATTGRSAVFPAPWAVGRAFLAELQSGRLFDDVVASLFRVTMGSLAAAWVGVPLGLGLGRSPIASRALLPLVNFLRSISPLAWIPFAVVWFGIGDPPAVFLIALSTVFPLAMATASATTRIPRVYLKVAKECHFSRFETLARVVFPAILPELVAAFRVTTGIAWLVVVPAEMLAGRDGLGFAVMDARNGLRMDLLVLTMIVIGGIGISLDALLTRVSRSPRLCWGRGSRLDSN